MRDHEDSKLLSQQRFGARAGSYVTSTTHAQGVDLDRLPEIAQPEPEWTVLDVATGGGHTALKFAPHVAQVVATDLTPEMLDAAREFIAGQGVDNVEFKLADAEDLPFDAETFELVTCRLAPHHFPDAARFVRECARVLKPGGTLLVQDQVLPEDVDTARYVNGFEKLRDPSHNRAFPASEWRCMFEEAGLTVEHTEQIVKRHQFIAWAEQQDCTPEVIQRLTALLADAPPAAAQWMQPRNVGTLDATFVIHHFIIAGRKS